MRLLPVLGLIAAWVALAGVAAPSAAPPLTLAGITIGESRADVSHALGAPVKSQDSRGAEYLVGANVHVFVSFSNDNVNGIVALLDDPKETGSSIVDPFGIRLGDPISRVREVRGEPDRHLTNGDRYLLPGGGFWSYEEDQDVPDPCHTAKGPFHVGVIGVTTMKYGVPLQAISQVDGVPWTPEMLAGISLGDTREAILQRFGAPTNAGEMTDPRKTAYSVDDGDMIYVDYDPHGNVEAIQVFESGDGKVLAPVDAFGVSLNDSLAELIRLRGQPLEQHQVTVGPYDVTYSAGPDARWTYLLYYGKITWIILAKNSFTK